jgi:hypothetical protein
MHRNLQPLTNRLDPLLGAEVAMTPSAWEVRLQSGAVWQLELPIYSRILHDSNLSDGLAESLANALHASSTPWLSGARNSLASNEQRISPIGIDEPIAIESIQGVAAIELQMFGAPFKKIPSNQFAHWQPAMPIELFDLEQLGKKVSAIREAVHQRIAVGAAVVALEDTIYDDVRYLIDSGVDWIEIISSAYHDLNPNAVLEFSDTSAIVSKAVKARGDSRQSCALWLSATVSKPKDWSRWLGEGINACCIDSFLTCRRPFNYTPRDTLAGIRIPSAASTTHDWIAEALRELKTALIDELGFRGYL